MRHLLAELRQRSVFKVATAYMIGGWIVLQFGSVMLQNFAAPGWALKAFTLLVLLGFPLACGLAWILEVTPEGVRLTRAGDPEARAQPRRSDWIWGGLLLILLVLASLNLATQWNRAAAVAAAPPRDVSPAAPQPGTAPADASAPASIAVLPFVDLSESGDQQYFGDGIAEELLNALARIDGLRVVARTSAFSFHGKDATMQQIGATLHVRHVLEGSVRRSGKRVRITAQLIDVESGYHLFSQSYDRGVEDVFAIQNEVAREIVTALLPQLGVAADLALLRRQTESQEAHELRMKARHIFFSPTPASLQQAIGLVQQAVAIDPGYAAAWGDLSYAHAFLAAQGGTEPLVSLVRAVEAANRALAHDPQNPTALLTKAAVASVIEFDYPAAEVLFAQVRAAGADLSYWADISALFYLLPLGRYEEAIVRLREAQSLDPLSPLLVPGQMLALRGLGRLPEALALAEETLNTATPPPRSAFFASQAFLEAGRLEEASRLVEYVATTMGEQAARAIEGRARINAARGDLVANQQMLEQAMARRATGGHVAAFTLGIIHLSLAQTGEALQWFERAVDTREPVCLIFLPDLLRRDPALHGDARAQALLQRMKLPLEGIAVAP